MSDDIRQRSIDTIRALAMDAVEQAQSGHPGTAMALAPVAYVLYRDVLRFNPGNPEWPGRDRFVLSAGHACILQYAALHLAGYALSLEDLKRFRQWESATPGHPEHFMTPGVETTTGPLGQGFANAVGMAMAERVLAQRYNRPGTDSTLVDHRIYVIASDGDLMEGVSQEAASLAGAFGLGKLTVLFDDNRITIDGTTALSWDHEDKAKRFEAHGWHVQHVDDANDVEALQAALAAARDAEDRPSLIRVRSHIAYPAPNARDTSKAHGAPIGEDEVKATKALLGFDPESRFVVPEDVAKHMDRTERGRRLEAQWRERFDAWRRAHPELAEEWERASSGALEAGWEDAIPVFSAGEKIATRAAGGKIMQAFGRHAPTMVGGAADLVESTKTAFEGAGQFGRHHAGRNVPFGVREHAMGAIVNGLALHGGIVKPFGSTFLIFSDYMRPAIRLSALMGLPVVWVFTHDSVGLGEDGPTHQPVEQCMALRAIPNLWVLRPADANETAAAWKVALERRDGPTALLLTRQAVPVIEPVAATARAGVERGGYVVWDSRDSAPSNGALDLVMIATGSEVWIALEAAKAIAADATVRVVSMPCWELFDAQAREYRDHVLPREARRRLAVEAGVSLGWHRWVGEGGDTVTIDRFGASAPGTTVLQRLGFTAENVAARARALLGR